MKLIRNNSDLLMYLTKNLPFLQVKKLYIRMNFMYP